MPDLKNRASSADVEMVVDTARRFRRQLGTPEMAVQNIDRVIAEFESEGKGNRLFDLMISPRGRLVIFSALKLATGAGKLADRLGRADEFSRAVAWTMRAVQPFDCSDGGKFLEPGETGPKLKAQLARLILGAQMRPHGTEGLIRAAAVLAGYVELPIPVAEFLFPKRADTRVLRAEWERRYRTAVAMKRLLARVDLTAEAYASLAPRADEFAAMEALRKGRGLLILLDHAGFNAIRRWHLAVAVKDIIFIAKRASDADYISVVEDPRAALFASLKELLRNKPLAIGPDGPIGRPRSSVEILGLTLPVSDGSAFLAHESKCAVCWYGVIWNGTRFAPHIVAGPTVAPGETFAAYKARFFRFFEESMTSFLTGDPINFALQLRWQSLLSGNGWIREGDSETS